MDTWQIMRRSIVQNFKTIGPAYFELWCTRTLKITSTNTSTKKNKYLSVLLKINWAAVSYCILLYFVHNNLAYRILFNCKFPRGPVVYDLKAMD